MNVDKEKINTKLKKNIKKSNKWKNNREKIIKLNLFLWKGNKIYSPSGLK